MTETAAPAPAPPSDPASAPAPAPVPDGSRFAEPPPPGPHPLASRRLWLRLAPLLVVLNLPFIHYALRGEAELTASVPFSDQFERDTLALGEHWFATGGFWRIVDGWLYSPGVKNNPLWLQARLPRDVVVEFDAKADSATGDIKCEIFGNGRDHASGYVLVFGGWNNTISTIARLDEHGRDRKERRDRKVEKGKVYRFRVERAGTLLTWSIDGEKFLEFDDKAPLEGHGHDRFGFGTWATDAFFDNLVITPKG